MKKKAQLESSRWTWLPVNPAGGAGGAAYSKLFKNDSFSPSVLLAREVLQNSWDAAQVHETPEAPKFRFVFRFREFRGKEKQELVRALGLGELAARREVMGERRDTPSDVEVERMLGTKSPLRVLYLEDYATHGMFGDPAEPISSHLHRALYMLGSTGKDDVGTTQGGSFGFGKSAFIRSSTLRSVIAHTRFARRPDDRATQRLVGFTWWGEHVLEGRSFEGRAMFGRPHDSGAYALPYEDDEAAVIAAALGMPARGADASSLGSTVMVLEPSVDADELCSAVESYWWPAIDENLMDVTVVGYGGEELVPRPRNRRDLSSFITAFGIAQGLKTPTPGSNERLASQKWRMRNGVRVGEMGLVVDNQFAEGSGGQESLIGDLSGPLVALIRGPRMVIEYRKYNSRMPIRGVFVASSEADGHLREVEPPLHNTWSVPSGTDVSEESRSVARHVLGSIDREVKTFALELAPPPAFVTADLPLFGQILAGFMTGRSTGPAQSAPIPGGEGGTLVITTAGRDVRIRVAAGRIRLTRRYEVQIPQDDLWRDASLRLSCTASIAEDLTGRGSESLDVTIAAPPGFDFVGGEATVLGSVDVGTKVEFSVTTSEYSDDLSIVLSPAVELRPLESIDKAS